MSPHPKVEQVFKVGLISFPTEEKAQEYIKKQEKEKADNKNGNKRKKRLNIRFAQDEMDFIDTVAQETGIQNKSEIVRTLFNMARVIFQSKELVTLFAKKGYAIKIGNIIKKEKEKKKETN